MLYINTKGELDIVQSYEPNKVTINGNNVYANVQDKYTFEELEFDTIESLIGHVLRDTDLKVLVDGNEIKPSQATLDWWK